MHSVSSSESVLHVVLEAYLRLCGKHGAHLISDKGYATSILSNGDFAESDFISMCSHRVQGTH